MMSYRPQVEHTDLEEELHERAHIDYDRVSIVGHHFPYVQALAIVADINPRVNQIANPSVPALYEDALVYETGSAITSSGALSAYSGAKTGRSPSDKRIVKEEGSEKEVWWGPVNKPMSPEVSVQRRPRRHLLPLFRQISPSSNSRMCFALAGWDAANVMPTHCRMSG